MIFDLSPFRILLLIKIIFVEKEHKFILFYDILKKLKSKTIKTQFKKQYIENNFDTLNFLTIDKIWSFERKQRQFDEPSYPGCNISK